MVFRELMMYDFYVADHFFDREQLLRKKENKHALEKYVVPLQTFWRPIAMDEYYETDLTDRRFFKKVGAIEDIEQRIGEYLAKPLRDSILNNRTQLD